MHLGKHLDGPEAKHLEELREAFRKSLWGDKLKPWHVRLLQTLKSAFGSCIGQIIHNKDKKKFNYFAWIKHYCPLNMIHSVYINKCLHSHYCNIKTNFILDIQSIGKTDILDANRQLQQEWVPGWAKETNVGCKSQQKPENFEIKSTDELFHANSRNPKNQAKNTEQI